MRSKILLLCAAILLIAADSYSCETCLGKGYRKAHAKATTAHAGEDDYDIKHLRFNLNVTDTATYIQGNVATTAQVVASSMTNYIFELGPDMIIDSAKVNGTLYTVSGTGPVRTITLSSALASGTMFTAQIFYHGTPPTGSGFFNGVAHAISSGGTHMMYTVSDPWVALNWWPCKQSVIDQADSVDMFIRVPAGVVDGSNGVLVNVDNTSAPGYSIYHWKTRYPIDYYLISLAVARYSEYRSYWHFTSSTDSMLIQNFFMDTATFNPAHKAKFDSVGMMIDYFSNLYGVRYPFWQEKYGMCFTALTGGMEHQTMTTIGVTDTKTIAHELNHQWFGDNVTYKTWGDMWLSEGFATFSEQLYYNHFWSPAAARAHRLGQVAQALSQPCGRTYVTDTSTSDSLFTLNQYPKAAIIINSLRYTAPEDSLFFKVLRIYQNTYALSNASTADFKAIAESVYGTNLDTFFNQWIYGRGYPLYKVSWNQSGSTVWVKLIQTQSCPSATNHFSTYVQLLLKAGALDTIVKVYNSLDTQVFMFDWPQTMTGVGLNTEGWTVLKQNGIISKDVTLGLGAITPGKLRILPNPTRNHWQVEELPADTGLALVDMNGRIIWEGNSGTGKTTIPGERLPAGNYMLKISGIDNGGVKLVHW
ncbi:MAG: M1 family aminopeptidase [Bacteroidota bacterium]